jgi:NAD(P)-dependent dehydrogenase (short-subunit alcohol dehydrogenase family)
MRTYLVTGAASGIGQATKQLLEARGERVIGADLRGSDIDCDLTTEAGRAKLVEEAGERADGSLDGVLAIAGLSAPIPATASVNYFGMVATLEGLRPYLLGSQAPRAAGVASTASLLPVDEALVAAMLEGDEAAAMARAAELAEDPLQAFLIYSSSKNAFARWIRQQGPAAAWAGASIPLNAVAPGVTATNMTKDLLADPDGYKAATTSTPMPLNGPVAPREAPARLLAWLTSEENSHLCGQVVFVDGGADAVTRGDRTW